LTVCLYKITNMKTNMGLLDRIIRIAIAILISALYFTNVIGGTAALLLLVVATAFVLTSFIGFCPLYFPFKITTRSKKSINA
jgi:hypothetical protein